jgi:hypothetical protein
MITNRIANAGSGTAIPNNAPTATKPARIRTICALRQSVRAEAPM